MPLPAAPTDRSPTSGPLSAEELVLASRNSGIPLEALRYDVTPLGLHYLLIHFDIPDLGCEEFRLQVGGRVLNPCELTLRDIQSLPQRTQRVTLECAGNGRAELEPRPLSQPWVDTAVGTADWTGTSLAHLLDRIVPATDAVDIAFEGADSGFDRGVGHAYGRSLTLAQARSEEVMLAWAMNGQPLAPQHGAPLRLVVPGWYGMASVKWLVRVTVLDRPYDGFQQTVGYHYRRRHGDPGEPVTHMRVRSLLVPPGVPDFFTRERTVSGGRVPLVGRAWSGAGVPIARVEVAVDGGAWMPARVAPPHHRYAWQRFDFEWNADPGTYVLASRATDVTGAVQPCEPFWTTAGFGNNSVHRVTVHVR